MYQFIEKVGQCYRLLQDDLSRKIFWARLAYDFDPSPENAAQIVSLGEEQGWLNAFEDSIPSILHTIERNPRKLVLYGTNLSGQAIAEQLTKRQIGFYGFCGRRYKDFPDGIMGKPVISPDCLFQNPDDFYVILAVTEASDEILNILNRNHFPQEQILACLKPSHETDHQYFDFPSLYRHGTAFIDAGCLDCRTSYIFVDWCRDAYSKIFAFEPDPISYNICEQRLSNRQIRDFHLIQSGLSNQNGEVKFQIGLYGGSHIMEDGDTAGDDLKVVPVVTIDDTVKTETIGFIKMDIEGAELDALHGAKNVLLRDKPLLAISAYHRTGDMLAIMDYLHELVPEYHFWLRHYSIGIVDTVLYASTDVLNENG